MENVIRRLVRRYGTNCPFAIAERLGIAVWFRDLGESTRGFYCRMFRRRYIVIHERLDDRWRRFVCAHELAHDRLHPGLSRFLLDERSFFRIGRFESEANLFALGLLTAGRPPEPGETAADWLRRNEIPEEVIEGVAAFPSFWPRIRTYV